MSRTSGSPGIPSAGLAESSSTLDRRIVDSQHSRPSDWFLRQPPTVKTRRDVQLSLCLSLFAPASLSITASIIALKYL